MVKDCVACHGINFKTLRYLGHFFESFAETKNEPKSVWKEKINMILLRKKTVFVERKQLF